MLRSNIFGNCNMKKLLLTTLSVFALEQTIHATPPEENPGEPIIGIGSGGLQQQPPSDEGQPSTDAFAPGGVKPYSDEGQPSTDASAPDEEKPYSDEGQPSTSASGKDESYSDEGQLSTDASAPDEEKPYSDESKSSASAPALRNPPTIAADNFTPAKALVLKEPKLKETNPKFMKYKSSSFIFMTGPESYMTYDEKQVKYKADKEQELLIKELVYYSGEREALRKVLETNPYFVDRIAILNLVKKYNLFNGITNIEDESCNKIEIITALMAISSIGRDAVLQLIQQNELVKGAVNYTGPVIRALAIVPQSDRLDVLSKIKQHASFYRVPYGIYRSEIIRSVAKTPKEDRDLFLYVLKEYASFEGVIDGKYPYAIEKLAIVPTANHMAVLDLIKKYHILEGIYKVYMVREKNRRSHEVDGRAKIVWDLLRIPTNDLAAREARIAEAIVVKVGHPSVERIRLILTAPSNQPIQPMPPLKDDVARK